MSEAVPTRKKLTITLSDWKPAPEQPPRECILCRETKTSWRFADGTDQSPGHRFICRDCEYPNGRMDRIGHGIHWRDACGGAFDGHWIATANAVCRQITKERT